MRRSVVALLLTCTATVPVGAVEIRSECYVRFKATSTLHDFTGRVVSKPFTLTVSSGPDGKKTVSRVEVDLPVGKISTDHEKRDKKMREMFESERFPIIRGVVEDLDPDRIRENMINSESGDIDLLITLSIRDVTHEVDARVSGLKELGEQVSFIMEFPVSLKMYGLKPPSPFFGLIRVGDEVKVEVTFNIEAKPSIFFTDGYMAK